MKNLYITGGHLTPALAVIDYLQKKHTDVNILFIGRKLVRSFPPEPSHEQREVEVRGVAFFPIQAAKYHREHFLLNFLEILSFPISLFSVWQIFHEHRPQVILSFGGYVAFPVCVVGKLFGARIVIHEQTRVAGLANEVIAHIADKIAVSSESSLKFFPKNKTVVTGNPIRESLFREYKTPPPWINQDFLSAPFIYITGGSQGSQVINHTIATILPRLLATYNVIHQCGAATDHVYLKELETVRDNLSPELHGKYLIREWIEAREVSYLIRHAKFVISRAGANTVEELILAGTPAIFIPLSFAHKNEQEKNARTMVDARASLLIDQKDLLPQTLLSAIKTMTRRFDRMKQNALRLQSTQVVDGCQRLVHLLFD